MEWLVKFEDVIVHADSKEEASDEALNQQMLIESIEQY